MTTPTKEAMEKAKELWQRVFDAYRKAPLGTTIDKVGTPLIALEFTNYQKRVEELEKTIEGISNNIHCGACAEGIFTGAEMAGREHTCGKPPVEVIITQLPNPTSRNE